MPINDMRIELDPAVLTQLKANIFNSVNEGLLFLTPDGVILDCNREVSRSLGIDGRELIGLSCYDLVHPDDRAHMAPFLLEVLENQRAMVSIRLANSVNRFGFLDVHGSLIQAKDQKMILLLILDQTERNITIYRKMFLGQFDRFRLSPSAEIAAIENTCKSLGVLLGAFRVFISGITPAVDPKASLVDCEYRLNDAMDSMVGHEFPRFSTPLDNQPHSTRTFFIPKKLRIDDPYLQLLCHYQIATAVVYRIPVSDDREVILHIGFETPERIFGESEARIAVEAADSIADIIEISRLSNLADSAEDRYRRLFKQIPISLLLLDRDGTIDDFNKAAQNLFAFSSSRNKKINFVELFGEGESIQALDLLNRAQNDRVIGLTGKMRSLAGREFTFEANAFPFFEFSILVLVTDISEKKELEEHIINTQKMDSIGLLARGIANDFNNLLGGILGYLNLIQSSLNLSANEELVQTLGKIDQAVRRGATLTDKLQALSSQKKFKNELFDLGSMAKETMDRIMTNLDDSIEMEINLPPDPCMMVGDPDQLRQLIINLIINASDAMPLGGRLEISLASENIQGKILSAYPQAKPGIYHILSVSDTGDGMSDEVRQRIFEPFFTTKSSQEHPGLGLSLAYAIVKNHGGLIQIRSHPFAGTTVVTSFPSADTGIPRQTKEARTPLDRPFRILVVDDEEMIRDMTSMFLKRIGFQYSVAQNGQEAVDIYTQNGDKIDLVLMDIVMPKMDGREAAVRIKKLNPEAKILFMSGFTHDMDFMQSIQHASTGFLHKPFQLNDFLQALADALNLDQCPEILPR